MEYIYIILILALYFLPTFYAYHRKHKNVEAILILNLFAGWTFIGWLIALIWSAKK